MPPNRRLAAVWFADIVDYTRLAAEDERSALQLVRLFQTIVREVVSSVDGKVVKFLGDGALAEFSSVEAAARTAILLRRAFSRRVAELDLASSLRIGIHLGDIVTPPDGDLYGDGINVASRLHGVAEPGQIVLSDDAWRQLRQRKEYVFSRIGDRELKGIVGAMGVFDVAADPAAEAAWAEEFDLRSKPGARVAPWADRFSGQAKGAAVVAVAVATLLIALFVGGNRGFGNGVEIEEARVAIMPFRVAADPALEYLREGMVDLLAAKFTGEGGLSAADPGTVLGVWRRLVDSDEEDLSREQAIALARDIGAGQVVIGSLVGTAARLTMTANLVSVADGAVVARGSAEGSQDSLTFVVDRLAANLLSLSAGEEEERLGSLTSTSLPALRAYLEGKVAFRSGQYELAVNHFERALDNDPNFVLAALGLADAAGFSPRTGTDAALRMAWENRHRLSRRDSIYVTAFLGRNYPAARSTRQRLDDWLQAADALPDRALVWYQLGDVFLHDGRVLDFDDPLDLAADAFERALALEPTFGPALSHLLTIAEFERDTTATRRWAPQLSIAAGEAAELHSWSVPTVLGDSVAAHRAFDQFESFSDNALFYILGQSALDVNAAARAMEILTSRASTPEERTNANVGLHRLALDQGRPATARDAIERTALPADVIDRYHIRAAVFSVGDSVAAAQAAGRLADLVATDDFWQRASVSTSINNLCALNLWRVSQGEAYDAEVDAALATLRDPPVSRTISAESLGDVCALTLEAIRATRRGDADAADLAARLNSLLATGPPPDQISATFNLALARVQERLGNPAGALAAYRRRLLARPTTIYTADYLEGEARNAARVGDVESAERAYERYSQLRSDPEPALVSRIAAARAEIEQLIGEAD